MTSTVSFSDAERHHIKAFYDHRAYVLKNIEAAIKREKEEKRGKK